MRRIQLYFDLPNEDLPGILIDINNNSFIRLYGKSSTDFHTHSGNFDLVIQSWATDCPVIMEYYE